MDSKEFRQRGKEMIDYIVDYMDTIKDRQVTPSVEPGYLRQMMPLRAPHEPEQWDTIMQDVETKIMPGVTHWQHPDFHAYFPAGNSYPSILGDMLSSGLGILGFSWASSPVCTELETIIMNWIGQMSGLPEHLLPFHQKKKDEEKEKEEENNRNKNKDKVVVEKEKLEPDEDEIKEEECAALNSGGVLLGSASECVLVSMLSARFRAIDHYKRTVNAREDDAIILSKLVGYTSQLAHSCVRKAAMICMVKMRFLHTESKFNSESESDTDSSDSEYSLRGETVEQAINADLAQGLIPFYVCATFGTTSCCSFDRVDEIGALCTRRSIFLHVDAAYAGNALICPEHRALMPGLDQVDSINYNPNKWMLVNFDCSCYWVRDNRYLIRAMSVDPVYLRHKDMERTIDYRNWGISLSRRFRSLKLWFTIRSYGVSGLQSYIRSHCRLALEFDKRVRSDYRFELLNKTKLGLVCFSMRGENLLEANTLTRMLLESVLAKLHLTKDILNNNKYMIRFCVNAQQSNLEDIERAWRVIQNAADRVCLEYQASLETTTETTCNDINNNYDIKFPIKTIDSEGQDENKEEEEGCEDEVDEGDETIVLKKEQLSFSQCVMSLMWKAKLNHRKAQQSAVNRMITETLASKAQ